jgi:hypothetical protein
LGQRHRVGISGERLKSALSRISPTTQELRENGQVLVGKDVKEAAGGGKRIKRECRGYRKWIRR